MSKIKIEKIIIKIGDKEIPLTIEEARELKNILGETFRGENDEKEKEYIYIPSYPYYVYPNPYNPYRYPHYGETITWNVYTDNTTLTLSSSGTIDNVNHPLFGRTITG